MLTLAERNTKAPSRRLRGQSELAFVRGHEGEDAPRSQIRVKLAPMSVPDLPMLCQVVFVSFAGHPAMGGISRVCCRPCWPDLSDGSIEE